MATNGRHKFQPMAITLSTPIRISESGPTKGNSHHSLRIGPCSPVSRAGSSSCGTRQPRVQSHPLEIVRLGCPRWDLSTTVKLTETLDTASVASSKKRAESTQSSPIRLLRLSILPFCQGDPELMNTVPVPLNQSATVQGDDSENNRGG
jgi:hypothetical protein